MPSIAAAMTNRTGEVAGGQVQRVVLAGLHLGDAALTIIHVVGGDAASRSRPSKLVAVRVAGNRLRAAAAHPVQAGDDDSGGDDEPDW